jgi:hypothetical protein
VDHAITLEESLSLPQEIIKKLNKRKEKNKNKMVKTHRPKQIHMWKKKKKKFIFMVKKRRRIL